MKKKFVYIFAALAILLSCTFIFVYVVNYSYTKSHIDRMYNSAKSVPRTDACEVIYRYTVLLKAENRKETNFYTHIAKDIIETYQPKCRFRDKDILTFKTNYYGSPGYERENLFLECDSQTSVITEKRIIKNTDPQITLSDVFERIIPMREDSELLKSIPNWKAFIHLSKRVNLGKDFGTYHYVFVGEKYGPTKSGYLSKTQTGGLRTKNPTTYEMSPSTLKINRETLSLLSSHTGSYPVKFRDSNYIREVAMNISTKCTIDTEADESWLIKITEISNGIMEEKRLKDLEQKKEQLKQELEERLKREKEAKEQKEKNII